MLIAGMPISPASVSQHLKILREMHIVLCEENYPTVYYWINTDLANTHKAIMDMIYRIGKYFPQPHSEEIAFVGRTKGPVRPE